MKGKKIMTATEVAASIQDGQTIAASGFVASNIPEALLIALEKRFLETGAPRNLTYFYAGSQGSWGGTGGDRFAHKGMTKRVIAAHYATAPALGKCLLNNEFEGYNFPQGALTNLFREIAANKVGTITDVGLNTFVDPRYEGGKINEKTTEDLVEVINIGGREMLWFKTFPIDVAFIRGSYADENGNVSVHKEIGPGEVTAIAQAAKNSGGKVYVQVEKIVRAGTIDAKMVKIPGIYVDALIVAEPHEHEQSIGCPFDPSLSGEVRVPVSSTTPMPLDAKKIIGRRAAMELTDGVVVNLGVGTPEYVSAVASEEGISDYFTLTVEAGPIGGIPQGVNRFGSSRNAEAILCHHEQFDFYDGGGLDMAFLGLAETDKDGSINVSRFGPKLAGCGGFMHIAQSATKVFFLGTFTAGGLKTSITDGKLSIDVEGRERKFVDKVEQITFNGRYNAEIGKDVTYITERAVFKLRKDGIYLTEIAPGIDLQTQVLDLMAFEPKMDGTPKLMDERLFRDELVGLKK